MSHVILERDADLKIATLWLDYQQENRLSPALIGDFLAALDEVEAAFDVRALVVAGRHDKYFCTGLDLDHMMKNIGDMRAVVAYLEQMNTLFRRVTLFKKPTVAAVNGHAFGGGLFLAAHMDFRLMREDRGWICLPEVDINIPLLPGMLAVLEAVMPPHAVRRMYYSGKRYGGPEAVQLGFADGAPSAEELLPQARTLAAALGKKRTATYAEFKRRLRGPVVRALDEDDPAAYESTLGFIIKT